MTNFSTLLICFIQFYGYSQKFVDLSDELSNITHSMVINGNDYSLNEQVIVHVNKINFKKPALLTFYNVLVNVDRPINSYGKVKLVGNSCIYVKGETEEVGSKLVFTKPFGQEILLEKCKIFRGIKKGTPFSLWSVKGSLVKKGKLGDGTKVKRMYYVIKVGKKFMNQQMLTN